MRSRSRLTIILAILCAIACSSACYSVTDRAAFDAQYKVYKEACHCWVQTHPGSVWSYPGKELADMGPEAAPYLVEKMSKGDDPELFPRQHAALCAITHKRFAPSEIAEAARNHKLPELWVRWWNEDRAQTPAKFAERCAQLKKANPADAAQITDQIRDMGVDALPLIVDQIKTGDETLVPVVNRIMQKPVASSPAEVMEWWKANEKDLRLPAPPKA